MELFSNFGMTTLAAPLAATATSAVVANGEVFPGPANGDFFRVVLASPSAGTETKWEICLCAARSGNTLTLERAQEGTPAQSWAPGDKAENRITLGALRSLQPRPGMGWERRACIQGQWYGAAYGNGLFVAVGIQNYAMVSKDSIEWEKVQIPDPGNGLNAIAYGNGMFVAVGLAGCIISSPDGRIWARQYLGSNGWQGITFANGMFVAVANNGANRVMTSRDGIAWAQGANIPDGGWLGIAYGNGMFVAVAKDGANRIMSSPDAISWTARATQESNPGGADAQWFDIAYGSGTFVAVGTANNMALSHDGTEWGHAQPGINVLLRGIAYGSGIFVAAGANACVIASADGRAWEKRMVGASSDGAFMRVAYGNGAFVAVRNGGNFAATSGAV
jgi:hypothetical protein